MTTRALLNLSILAGTLATLAFLGMVDVTSAIAVYFVNGVAGMIANIATLTLAAEHCPERSEGFAFAALMSVINLANAARRHDRRVPLPASVPPDAGAADRGIGGIHRVHIRAGATARQVRDSATEYLTAGENEQACAGRGNPHACSSGRHADQWGPMIRVRGGRIADLIGMSDAGSMPPAVVAIAAGTFSGRTARFMPTGPARATGRMLRQFTRKIPRQIPPECVREFLREFGGRYTRSFRFCSYDDLLRRGRSTVTSANDAPPRAVCLLGLQNALIFAGHAHSCRSATARRAAVAPCQPAACCPRTCRWWN